eukprot:m.183800 g.183800  ORF g.183800 m.183800 type:complete len:356 (+) comp53507_c1_seq1:130-1197(+)
MSTPPASAARRISQQAEEETFLLSAQLVKTRLSSAQSATSLGSDDQSPSKLTSVTSPRASLDEGPAQAAATSERESEAESRDSTSSTTATTTVAAAEATSSSTDTGLRRFSSERSSGSESSGLVADPRMEEVILRFKKPQVTDADVLVSRRGTVVGEVGGVAARRKAFLKQQSKAASTTVKSLAEQLEEAEALAGEQSGGKLVVYLTTVQAVKDTYQACQDIVKILQRARVSFEVRDISMDARFNKELIARLSERARVPQVFLNGKYVGDYELVYEMNEGGVFQQILQHLPKLAQFQESECADCGGRGFYTCTWCGGSKKSISNRFGRSIISLKCTACNENGLMRCSTCSTASVC